MIVEGLYSMEGSYIDLPKLINLKKQYGFMIYVDEAHSIGSLGESGRGIRDHFHVDYADVDFCMGTFTKSFSSVGGYVTGKHELIEPIRANSFFFRS